MTDVNQELLDALKEVVSVLERGYGDEWDWAYGPAYEAREQALRAIEKADG